MSTLSTRVIGLALGSAPSFLLPFVAAIQLDPDSAATLLMGLAVAVTGTGVFATTFEAGVAAEATRAPRSGGAIALREVDLTSRRGLLLGIVGMAFLAPTVALLLTWASTGNRTTQGFVALVVVFGLAAVVATGSSAYAAVLVVMGRVTVVLLSASLRGGPALVALMLTDSLTLVAASYLLGEVARLFTLRLLLRSLDDTHPDRDHARLAPPLLATMNQSLSAVLTQGSPLITRSFLLAISPTAFVIGEMASRVLAVGSQVISSAYVLPAVVRVPAVFSRPERSVRAFMLESARAFAFGAAVSGLVVIAATVASLAGLLSPPLLTGLQWGSAYALALPFLAANLWAARVLIYSRRSVYLPLVASVMLVAVAVLSALLAPRFGGIGVILAGALAQSLIGAVAVALTAVLIRRGS